MTVRYTLLLFSLLLLGGTSLTAQQRLQLGNWQLKKVGAAFGQDQDMLGSMQANYFISTARAGSLIHDYSGLNLRPDDTYSMICENPHYRLNLTWSNPALPRVELGTNLLFISGRIDAMTFRDPDPASHNYLDISQYSGEVAVEPTLGYRLGGRVFNLTGIIGGNVGYHYGDLNIRGDVTICDDETIKFRNDGTANCREIYVSDSAPTRNGLSTRVFAEAKFSFRVGQRLELATHLRRGAGLRFTNGARTQTATLHSAGFSAAWVLR